MKIVALALLFATPAAADCVTAADLATGIIFTREDGRGGVVQGDGKTVRINYATDSGYWRDNRDTLMGIYELKADFHFDTMITVGGGHPYYTWTYASRGIAPNPGHSFRAQITQTRDEDIGTQVKPAPVTTAYDLTYAFLQAKQVTLSGCPYTVVPVEATYPDGAVQRWVYFPDLGFGLETRPRGLDNQPTARNGLKSMTPK